MEDLTTQVLGTTEEPQTTTEFITEEAPELPKENDLGQERKNEPEPVISTKQLDFIEMTDGMETHNFFSNYVLTKERTVEVFLFSQGIRLTSKVIPMSALFDVSTSENSRNKMMDLFFEFLTDASKSLFGGKIYNFRKAVSYYDIDFFAYPQIQTWGDEEFELNCVKCKNVIKFKTPIEKMLQLSKYAQDRLEKIKSGEKVGMVQIEDQVEKLNEDIDLIYAIPSLEKHMFLSRMNIPAILYWRLLHLEGIIFNKNVAKPVKISLNEDNAKYFIELFDTIPTGKMDEGIEKRFDKFNVSFEGRIQCTTCGTMNTAAKTDLLSDLVFKSLS